MSLTPEISPIMAIVQAIEDRRSFIILYHLTVVQTVNDHSSPQNDSSYRRES